MTCVLKAMERVVAIHRREDSNESTKLRRNIFSQIDCLRVRFLLGCLGIELGQFESLGDFVENSTLISKFHFQLL
jgi:hypothetical protein